MVQDLWWICWRLKYAVVHCHYTLLGHYTCISVPWKVSRIRLGCWLSSLWLLHFITPTYSNNSDTHKIHNHVISLHHYIYVSMVWFHVRPSNAYIPFFTAYAIASSLESKVSDMFESGSALQMNDEIVRSSNDWKNYSAKIILKNRALILHQSLHGYTKAYYVIHKLVYLVKMITVVLRTQSVYIPWRPSHQGVLPSFLSLELQLPVVDIMCAGLHGIARWHEDSCNPLQLLLWYPT